VELSVSVIIPNHNYGRYVGAAIESALAQTYPPLEVIVVDNGSTDDSRAVLEKFDHPKLRVVFQENKGQSGARNVALALARGDLIGFLDADDVWLPEKLSKQVALFSDPEVVLVYCGLKKVDARLQPLPEPLVMPKHRGHSLDKFALEAGAVVCGGESTALLRSDIVRASGLFDSALSIGAGWDFWRRMASRGKIDFCGEVLGLYRQHGSNLSRRLDTYASDTELKLEKMFEDPASQAVWKWKRKSLGVHRMALAGAYIQAYDPLRAIFWGVKAVFTDPTSFSRVFGWPLRFFRRRLM